jgi:hypothetical protein
MRFTRYPKGEPYQITSRKLSAARRAVQREKDRYPLFPELVKHQAAEDRLASIAVERETWWQEMRAHQAQLWRKARQPLRDLPTGPRAAIKRYCASATQTISSTIWTSTTLPSTTVTRLYCPSPSA